MGSGIVEHSYIDRHEERKRKCRINSNTLLCIVGISPKGHRRFTLSVISYFIRSLNYPQLSKVRVRSYKLIGIPLTRMSIQNLNTFGKSNSNPNTKSPFFHIHTSRLSLAFFTRTFTCPIPMSNFQDLFRNGNEGCSYW